MNPIGTILDFCVNTQCKIIPFGYLECDGKIIEKQKYIELFYSLNINDSTFKLPKFNSIQISENVELIKIIKAFNTQDRFDAIGDSEFLLK